MAKTVGVIGAGIVGLAAAWKLSQKFPEIEIVVFEKESSVAAHQTGRNSGVIHSGIYYRPGSAKATNCRKGRLQLEEFCRSRDVQFERCGKIIVATDSSELEALATLEERGSQNGVRCRRLSAEGVREIEPHVSAVAGLHVLDTGIVDYRRVSEKLASELMSSGHQLLLGHAVTAVARLADHFVVRTRDSEISVDLLINCAGLYSDRIARLCGHRVQLQIIPFRGEYYETTSAARRYCRNLIYPVPDARFPFLGVHFTRMIGGGVECGPNAVLAFGREAYSRFGLSAGDLAQMLRFAGFGKMAARYWRVGLGEMARSLSKKSFTRSLQQLVPEIQETDLVPAKAGIRAQAVNSAGELIDDFAFAEDDRSIHVLNAPSPAATACLAIADEIVERLGALI